MKPRGKLHCKAPGSHVEVTSAGRSKHAWKSSYTKQDYWTTLDTGTMKRTIEAGVGQPPPCGDSLLGGAD